MPLVFSQIWTILYSMEDDMSKQEIALIKKELADWHKQAKKLDKSIRDLPRELVHMITHDIMEDIRRTK